MIAQVALSLVLLVTSGLTLKSFSVPWGFRGRPAASSTATAPRSGEQEIVVSRSVAERF